MKHIWKMDFYTKGNVIMATKNDNLIMQLKEKVELKRKELNSFSIPAYKTNLVLDMDGQKTNINVLNEDGLRFLLVKMADKTGIFTVFVLYYSDCMILTVNH